MTLILTNVSPEHDPEQYSEVLAVARTPCVMPAEL